MKPIKKVALLHSMCSVGKASITNMFPILSVLGVEVCPIPTVLYSTHTGGYGMPAMQSVSVEYIRGCKDHFLSNNITFDAIFIGYLGNIALVDEVLDFVKSFPNAKVILDPIMGDHGNFYKRISKENSSAFHKLMPYADIMLPNLTEACLLTDMAYKYHANEMDVHELFARLKEIGANDVVITSIPGENSEKNIAICTEHGIDELSLPMVNCEFHGTGDVFDAVFIGSYLNGFSQKESVIKAHNFVSECIKNSVKFDYEEREGLMIEKTLSMLV